MLKQQVSMNREVREVTPSVALVVLDGMASECNADPVLSARLNKLCTDSGMPAPVVLPGAMISLLAVPLPLNSDRRRREALPFAVEPFLASPLEETTLALGRQMPSGDWICAVAQTDELEKTLATRTEEGPVLADLLAVPLPREENAWSLWCSPDAVHVRRADGTGLTLRPGALAPLWKAQGRPELHLLYGTAPLGITVTKVMDDPSDPDPEILALDLRPDAHRETVKPWLRLARFAAGVAVAGGLLQSALLHLDANALAQIADERSQLVTAQLFEVSSDLNADQPLRLILSKLAQIEGAGNTSDPFLALLSQSSRALNKNSALSFREVRYDRSSQSITVQVMADDLEDLQQAETALGSLGLRVTSGAASSNEAGAEMQLVIAGAG